MAKQINKSTGLNNVSETWDQNERARAAGKIPDDNSTAPAGNGLEKVIKEEAAAYDNSSAEERLMPNDRATENEADEEGNRDA